MAGVAAPSSPLPPDSHLLVYPTPYGLWMPSMESMARLDLRIRQRIDLQLTPEGDAAPGAHSASMVVTSPITTRVTTATGAIATAKVTTGARRITAEQRDAAEAAMSAAPPAEVAAPASMSDEWYRRTRLRQMSERLKSRLGA